MEPTARRTVFRACTLCEATCGLAFDVEGDRVASVRNDPEDPFSRGYCCPKGLASGALHHDPDRLAGPRVRGARGELEPASWDEALERACDGLARVVARHGPDALGVYVGNPVVHNLGAMVGTEVVRALLPTRNRYSANSQDVGPHLLANYLTFGAQLSHPVPDLDRTRYLLVVGANPLVSNGSMMTAPRVGARLRAIQRRGGRVVVVDPRRTETARVADEHHFVRPGTDALLLLALAREVCAGGGWDRAFLERWASGWERLPELLAPFTPERVAPHLGGDLDAAAVRRLAGELVGHRPAAVYARLGVCHGPFAGLAAWGALLLNVVTGSLDREGGVMFPDGPASWIFGERLGRGSYDRYRSPQGCPELAGEYPCHVLAAQVEGARSAAPEAVHGLLVVAGNPVLSVPNGPRLAAALRGLDALVAVDVYPSETAALAHVVLPPRSALHEPHFDPVFQHLAVEDTARWSPRVLPPRPGDPSELDVLVRLAVGVYRRLPRRARSAGRTLLARLAPALTVERLAAAVVRFGPRGAGLNPFSRGWTLEALRALEHGAPPRPLAPRLGARLFPRGRRVACAPAPVVADLPRLAATLAAPPPDAASLLLVGRRDLRSNNSWMHNLPELRGKGDRCRLAIHQDDARARGLAQGGRAVVRSAAGAIEVAVDVTQDVMRGVVSLPHGWGHATHGGSVARAEPGASANDLTSEAAFDPLSGNSVLSGVPVTVEPAPGAALPRAALL